MKGKIMLTRLNYVAAFAAGIGCGVLATYSYFHTKYEKLYNEEMAALDAVMRERKEKDKDISEKTFEQTGSTIVNMEKRSNELTNYNKMTESYISSVPPADNEIENRIADMHDKMEKLAEAEHPVEESGEQYEITSMDWLDDPFYDKVELIYYVGDDTMANEAGQIDDVGMSIGMEMFEYIKNSDKFDVYIRNPSLGIDYNVVKDMGCYHVG